MAEQVQIGHEFAEVISNIADTSSTTNQVSHLYVETISDIAVGTTRNQAQFMYAEVIADMELVPAQPRIPVQVMFC